MSSTILSLLVQFLLLIELASLRRLVVDAASTLSFSAVSSAACSSKHGLRPQEEQRYRRCYYGPVQSSSRCPSNQALSSLSRLRLFHDVTNVDRISSKGAWRRQGQLGTLTEETSHGTSVSTTLPIMLEKLKMAPSSISKSSRCCGCCFLLPPHHRGTSQRRTALSSPLCFSTPPTTLSTCSRASARTTHNFFHFNSAPRQPSRRQQRHRHTFSLPRYTPFSISKFTTTTTTTTTLPMALIPIPVSTLNRILVTGMPTPSQYSSYWGRTTREQYAGVFEAASVTFLGVFCSYFLSFVVGQVIATAVGFVFATWILINPELKAYQRNWELRGGRDFVDPWMADSRYDGEGEDYEDKRGSLKEDRRGLYGAFYFGRVTHVAVVEEEGASSEEEYDLREEFGDYTMETDELEKLTGLPYQLRLRVSDSEGRNLQIHARMSEEYLDIRVGMPVACVLLSTSQKFYKLAGMTDVCIPDAQCWVGDYPYLDRAVFERVIGEEDLSLWDALQAEMRSEEDWANDEYVDESSAVDVEQDGLYDDDPMVMGGDDDYVDEGELDEAQRELEYKEDEDDDYNDGGPGRSRREYSDVRRTR